MKIITDILKRYYDEIEKETDQEYLLEIKRKLKLSTESLNQLREVIRENEFPSQEEEINFFKYQKPILQGHLFFYGKQLSYYIEGPKLGSELQKQYLKKKIKRYENRKKRNIEFYVHYIQRETASDHLYFLRKNIQLYLFTKNFQMNKDPLFTTNKSNIAAEIVANGLIIDFFNNELNNIFGNKKEVKPEVLTNLSWTGSKTDLVELLFALKEAGAIRYGNPEMKKLKEASEALFNIKLGNIHKTFSQIKARQKDPTKFLDTLKNGLLQKINYDQW
tara:strand:- start:681 stop:1508 length:828 start_codon:yes stop_codon:yes gene_type:complete